MRRPSGVQTGELSMPGSKVNCVSVSRAHSYTQMSRCLPSEMSSASFWPSGENRGFAQSAFAARSTDVLPSRVIQSIGFALVAAVPGTYTSVPSEDTASCAPPVVEIRGDAFERRHRLAHRLEAIAIEAHGEERALLQVDQITARHVPAVMAAADDDLRRPAREGRDDEVGAVPASLRRECSV